MDYLRWKKQVMAERGMTEATELEEKVLRREFMEAAEELSGEMMTKHKMDRAFAVDSSDELEVEVAGKATIMMGSDYLTVQEQTAVGSITTAGDGAVAGVTAVSSALQNEAHCAIHPTRRVQHAHALASDHRGGICPCPSVRRGC